MKQLDQFQQEMGYTTPSSLEEGRRQGRSGIDPSSASAISLPFTLSPDPLPAVPFMSLRSDSFLKLWSSHFLLKILLSSFLLIVVRFPPVIEDFPTYLPSLLPEHAFHTICASAKMVFLQSLLFCLVFAHQTTPSAWNVLSHLLRIQNSSEHGSSANPFTKPIWSHQAGDVIIW